MSEPFPDDAWPPPPGGVRMVLYTVYDRPLDHEHHWVVRRWFIMDGKDVPIPDHVPRIADTLDGARRHIPPGLVRLVDVHDDPFLFESWV